MSQTISREIRLKNHPVGMPSESDFELAEVSIPEPGESQVLVRNLYMSVDPYMRGRMHNRPSYFGAFQLGQPLDGGCVGRVAASRNDRFPVGEYVLGSKGWREYFLSDGSDLTPIDPKRAPVQAYLGVLGMPGMTAYVGLLDIGQLKEGEAVFVSGAAGAVGSAACQIAKIRGCRVVGSAGSEAKIAWLRDVAGVDAAFNYRQVEDLKAELGRLCPNGLDLYFDNVGSEHLEAALDRMNAYGRVVLCGAISRYNDTQPAPGPSNLFLAITRRLRLQGFIVSDHADRRPQFLADMSRWTAAGQLKWEETIFEGIENAPQAFLGLFTGENLGKMLVKLGPDSAVE
jgi:NADPH-dependent curcumin reductase CurA